MTTFTLTGQFRKPRSDTSERPEVSITWTDGVLSGDELAVAAVLREAARAEGHCIAPIVGGATWKNHLEYPYTAHWFMVRLFDAWTVHMTGELPVIPGLKEFLDSGGVI